MKKLINKLTEGILMLSSIVTTLTVLLIIVFLFSEGLSVFKESPLEGDNIIVLNHHNTVSHITSSDIKDIFDQNITNWKSLGGSNDSIILFTFNDIGNYFSEEELGPEFEFLPAKMDSLLESENGMIAVFSSKYLIKNHKSKVIQADNITPYSFLTGKEWFPTANPAVQLGVLPLILGTLYVSFVAIIFALPVGLATAIYMAEVADEKTRRVFKPVIELLAGIPSVVYGFFGLIVIVPLIQSTFHLPVGETGLAGSIILGIMALPTIITVSEDALRNTPRSMKEASLALGATRWQTIVRIVIPYSYSGISAAAILGIGRAIGETMAVLMVTGNAAVIPHTLLEPVRTIPATIAAELGEAPANGIHYKALFALGCILFLITLTINLWVEFSSKKRRFGK
ncbi:MAG TPA: phosphate ABC transporter permease subunit PstC [Bacteroidia bacterium]|nr:phosphate ABC transporter permease subunit PstC [Bacteroidia bacterium]HQF28385.1 phosphate ABC transporter permease subunit PstC [Bacteroidia bacterium]HQK97005.1 phosphate ABC transporter permease subunit PstC [Bacteroidia bacterium]